MRPVPLLGNSGAAIQGRGPGSRTRQTAGQGGKAAGPTARRTMRTVRVNFTRSGSMSASASMIQGSGWAGY